ncbi:hypothetical protein GGR52DRAFT_586106 [Hypoxylon sp. FL1284]|nr:hypothetical protein GGR52DRAFT_586106 [Hypoxylon sp. FL1284]
MSMLWLHRDPVDTTAKGLTGTGPERFGGGDSDGIIFCQNETWKVDLNVVRRSSLLLKDFFQGGHSELRITGDFHPEVLARAIHHMYYGGITTASCSNDLNQEILNCLKLWALADALSMETLVDECEKQLAQYLRSKVVSYQRLKCNKAEVPAEELAGISQGIRYAYKMQPGQSLNLFDSFIIDTHFWVLQEAPFIQLAHDIPEFLTHVKETIKVYRREGEHCPKLPRHCEYCGLEELGANNHWAKIVPGRHKMPTATCYKCWLMLDNYDTDEHVPGDSDDDESDGSDDDAPGEPVDDAPIESVADIPIESIEHDD